MSHGGKHFIVGVFGDDDVLKSAVGKVRGNGVNIFECYTPFPVHGLEHELGYKPTRLPIVAFLFAMTGLVLALTCQVSMMVIDWPINIGGKPFFAYADFVPVTFEFSILCTAFGMVGTFMVRSDLKPYKINPMIFDKRQTDDKHIMAIDLENNSLTEEEIKSILVSAGAEEVNRKDFEQH
jgi:hypothetical protein